MKIIRYADQLGNIHYGQLQKDGTAMRGEGDPFHGLVASGEKAAISKLLAPIVPPQIFCIGLNYRRHAEETGLRIPERPIMFIKANNALQNPGDPIRIPVHAASTQVDYECELAVVIGRSCKNVKAAEALDFVLGYTCGNDVSARDWQIQWSGGQWSRAKSFDTFCPLGPCLVTTDEIPDPQNLRLRTVVNGETLQDSHTSDMIFTVAQIVEFLSASNTLPAGTVILTGTPPGVGMARQPPRWLVDGDVVTIDIEKIGQLTNPVAREI